MKKILITGGTGFVGRHLAELLERTEPESEIFLTSQRKGTTQGRVCVQTIELTDGEALRALIKKIQPEEIYHLASLSDVGASFHDPAGVLANNFGLTLNLLETVRQLAPQTKVLLVSSGDIYDHRDQAAITEERLVSPASPYSASKAMQDILGQTYSRSFGMKIIIVRPFNHIGPGQRTGFVVADFASQIAKFEKERKPAQLAVGNLAARRDFTDVRDMVRAYQLLMQKGQIGEIYNVGTGKGVKIETILGELLSLTQAEIVVMTDKSKFRPIDAPVIVAETAKINNLGWTAEIPRKKTLGDILDYWRGIINKQSK